MDAFSIYTGVNKRDFAFVWFGGTQNESNFNKKATRSRLEKVAVRDIADEVRDKAAVSSIRYAGTLLKGLSQVVRRKSVFLEKDCFAFHQQLKNTGSPAKVQLDKTKKPDKQLFITELDQTIFEDFDVPDVTLLDKDPNRAALAEITLREESDFINPDELRDMDPSELPENFMAGDEWLEYLQTLENFEDYQDALAVGEEAPSLASSIPAPGPEFELDPEQPEPADFEQDLEQPAPVDFEILPEQPNQSRVDPPATSQEDQPAVTIPAPEESTIGTSGTTNEDENNNEPVTEKKKGRKPKAQQKGLIIDTVISLLDPSLSGLSRKGLEEDESKLTVDQAPFLNFEGISLGGALRGRVLAARSANRKEIFSRFCSERFLADEINLNQERARKEAASIRSETISSNRRDQSTGWNLEQDAASNANAGASISRLSDAVNNITINVNSSAEPTKASTPIVPGVTVTALPEVTFAPIAEDNLVQPPAEPPIADLPQFVLQSRDLKDQIRDWLPADKSWANFHDFCHENSMKRSQAALAFSALMVLLKKEVVDQKQEDPYGPILVRLL